MNDVSTIIMVANEKDSNNNLDSSQCDIYWPEAD